MPDDARVKLGIVIPLFNQLAHTQAMLASLRATLPGGADGPQHEVVLVDDGSTDDTREWLATLTWQPGLRVVLNPNNLGFAAACNAGAAACPGAQVLAFLNNDLRLTPAPAGAARGRGGQCAAPPGPQRRAGARGGPRGRAPHPRRAV
jgi:GT2 family glycosyltransferase